MNQNEKLVHSPSHYVKKGIEVIDIISAYEWGFNLGNVVKYVLRGEHKEDLILDLEKAAWYLNRQITNLKNGEKNKPVDQSRKSDWT